MAQVCLGRTAVQTKSLPAYCIHCGSPGADHIEVTLTRFPWFELLMMAVCGLAGAGGHVGHAGPSGGMRFATAAITGWLPLCGNHVEQYREHRRSKLKRLALVFLLPLIAALIVYLVLTQLGIDFRTSLLSAWLTFTPAFVVGFIVVTVHAHHSIVRIVDLGEHTVTLRGVSDEFHKAWVVIREQRKSLPNVAQSGPALLAPEPMNDPS
jgi:hypothetical protein